MRAYIVKSQKTIEPFGDKPQGSLIANETLALSQISALSDLNLEVVSMDDDHIQDREVREILSDCLYFIWELMA